MQSLANEDWKMSKRLFIAVELNDAIKHRIQEAQSLLKTIRGKVGWTKPEQMHLTLKFLGNVDEEKIPAVLEGMNRAVSEAAAFHVDIEGLGAFPSQGRINVLWVGIKPNSSLAELHKCLEDEMSAIGFEREEREFSPHLTLGRVREAFDGLACRKLLEQHRAFPVGGQVVDRIILFSSELNPTGAVYSIISCTKFSKKLSC
jgi:2'-5' RNA ligase